MYVVACFERGRLAHRVEDWAYRQTADERAAEFRASLGGDYRVLHHGEYEALVRQKRAGDYARRLARRMDTADPAVCAPFPPADPAAATPPTAAAGVDTSGPAGGARPVASDALAEAPASLGAAASGTRGRWKAVTRPSRAGGRSASEGSQPVLGQLGTGTGYPGTGTGHARACSYDWGGACDCAFGRTAKGEA